MKQRFVLAGLLTVLTAGCIGIGITPPGSLPKSTTPASQAGLKPTPFVCRAAVVEQSFEHGFMFWIGRTTEEKCTEEHSFARGTGEIWVAFVNRDIHHGKWLIFVDDWDSSSEPETDPSLIPAAGLIQPKRGFGKTWRIHLSQKDREILGWATGEELAVTTEYHYDAAGLLNAQNQFVARPGKHFINGLAGDTFVFDEISQTVDYVLAPQ